MEHSQRNNAENIRCPRYYNTAGYRERQCTQRNLELQKSFVAESGPEWVKECCRKDNIHEISL